MKTRIQRLEEKRAKFKKQMIQFIGILICIAGLFWLYNFFRLETVSLEGLTRYTEEEFRTRLEDNFLMTITPVFALSDRIEQKEIPFIEKYETFYVDEHTARVIVHEKRITGCVLIMGRYMYFDKDGIIVESSTERIKEIPMITGLEFQEIALYRKLQIQKQGLYDTILQLTRLIEQNEILVEEIAFDSNYEVTLFCDGIVVELGKKENYDEALNALQGILQKVQTRTGSLDMRNYSKENLDVILKK